MPPRKSKVKAKEERINTDVKIRLIPYYGITFIHPALNAVTATGPTVAEAMVNARAAIAHLLPHQKYNVTVTEVNPDTFERAGVHFETK